MLRTVHHRHHRRNTMGVVVLSIMVSCIVRRCDTVALAIRVIVEAIPMYIEELLLQLTCYVEGTS